MFGKRKKLTDEERDWIASAVLMRYMEVFEQLARLDWLDDLFSEAPSSVSEILRELLVSRLGSLNEMYMLLTGSDQPLVIDESGSYTRMLRHHWNAGLEELARKMNQQ